MKLLVGLGNPGAEYALTRHNVGFWVAEGVHAVYGLPAFTKKCKGMVSKGKIGGEDFVVLKPMTFMNLSGESVRAAVDFYKIKLADILVVHDDLDLAVGRVKHKTGGSDAGHNGLKSMTAALGSADYARLRLGIGRPAHQAQVSDYVLEPFAAEEELVMRKQVAYFVEHMGEMFQQPQQVVLSCK